MKEKFQVANDSSYLERSNLERILQKHKVLESELSANTRRVEDVVLQGNCLVQDKHFASIAIEKTVDKIQGFWNELKSKTIDRGKKLQQASEKRVFDWSIEDFLEWLSSIEKALTSEELGHDLNSVNNFIKKHSLLEADIVAHRERVNEFAKRVEEFEEDSHFQFNEIRQKADEATGRYGKLTGP